MNNDICPINLLNEFNTCDEKEKKNSPKKKPKEMKKIAYDIDYKYFFKHNVLLKKFTLEELKYITKKYNLKISGNKSALIERIITLFKNTKSVIKIQTLFRKWIVQQSIKIRGPAFKNRKLCVNDNDFVTLEPINEITNDLFYSYKDDKQFVYGFNIASLIQIIRIKNKLNNPYNRDIIDGKQIADIIKLYNLCFIIYPEFKNENQRFVERINNTIRTPQIINRNIINNIIINGNSAINDYNPQINNNITINDDQYRRLQRLREIRLLPINQRINNLFIEIDHLGNYTQASWFNLLEARDYIIIYRAIYDIWYYRSNLDATLRYNICPFITPFFHIHNNYYLRNSITEQGTDYLRQLCLIIFENLVYTGADDDYRRIGTFHALSSLTLVSLGARLSMPWLYESITYN
jgi:hypothetical protein